MAGNRAKLNGTNVLHKTMHQTDADDPNIPIVGFSGNVHR